MKIQPYMIFIIISIPMYYIAKRYVDNQEEKVESLQTKSLLRAKRKTQERMMYAEDEITGGEDLIIQSSQYTVDVQNKVNEERRALEKIKRIYLTDGLYRKQAEKVDIKELIQKQQEI
mmetsp:Transcript_12819/g.21701  ORF Transcript_12819/g.21701 Transcript_12819/m.21701 type:complete len:118 (-) Transcript_12819:19-372(-)